MKRTEIFRKRLAALDWEFKNRGYEIVDYYGTDWETAFDYIEDHFEEAVATVNKPKGFSLYVGYIPMYVKGYIFHFKVMSEEETRARNIMNKLGLGERKPEIK